MSERERIIEYLIRQGYDRDFATWAVDNRPDSFMVASARFTTSLTHFANQLTKPFRRTTRA
jgi:hypothetical protein